MISTLVVYARDLLGHGQIRAGRPIYKSTPLCNECVYNALGEPTNFHPRE